MGADFGDRGSVEIVTGQDGSRKRSHVSSRVGTPSERDQYTAPLEHHPTTNRWERFKWA